MPRLRWREIAVEDEQVRAQRHRADEDLLELALAHQRAGVDLPPGLEHQVEHLDVGGSRQLLQFLKGCLCRRPITRVHADQDRAARDAHRPDRRDPRHLLLERGDLRLRIELQVVEAGCLRELVQVAGRVPGHQRRQVDLARQPVVARHHGRDGVQPQEHEVGEVVAGQRLVLEVGMHQPEAAQARMAGAGAADLRQDELARVAHDHMLDLTPAIDEDAELPANFLRQFGEMARQLRGDQLALLHAPAPRGEQALAVACLQSRRVSGKLFSHLGLVCNTRAPLLHLDRRIE